MHQSFELRGYYFQIPVAASSFLKWQMIVFLCGCYFSERSRYSDGNVCIQ